MNMSENTIGVGLASPDISSGRRKMLDLVNRLSSTGVQVDLDLPQIAVIGAQSAGKSSLIESISGVTLPRASGTCTRCPTECRLSKSDSQWQCVVSLRIITDSSNQPLGQAHNEQFGDIITDRSEVEDRIRRAQRAILNPQKPAHTFLEHNDRLPTVDSLSFSHNSVVLQISGPDVADLSFCDLPGLIASVSSDRGTDDDITLVKNLVTLYIKKPSCIILLTVACETDFENQGAHNLAKQYDPEGKRTIGVLTKPDRIQAGEAGSWVSFVKNEREALEHNWFCVKQPSPDQLKSGITWEEARTSENNWFSATAPWCELEGRHQKYLRTGNLVSKLSIVLSDLIAERLPQIYDELERSIIECRTSLAQLPPPSTDPRSEIAALLHNFSNDVARHAAGLADDPDSTEFGSGGIGLIQAVAPVQERFRLAIRATAPDFRPYERSDNGFQGWSSPGFLEREEGRVSGSPTVIYIDEVLERANMARTRELPGNYPFVVQKTFIKRIVAEWRTPSRVLCKAVYGIVLDHSRRIIAEHFRNFGMGHLEQRIAAIIHHHLKQCLERAEERIDWLLALEDVPFSLNTHYLADYKDKFISHYRAAREQDGNSQLASHINEYKRDPSASTTVVRSVVQHTGIAKILSGLAEVGVNGIKADDLSKLLSPDHMEPALVIMADVRAYFQVAYKRFVDVVSLAIDHELVRGVERNLLTILYTSLAVNGPDGAQICQAFAEEHPHIADKRADLKRKLERLDNAGEELRAVAI